MNRRLFLASLGALGSAYGLPPEVKIADVRVARLEGSEEATVGVNGQRQVRPLDVYEEHRPAPYREPANGERRRVQRRANYLTIKTDQGVEGLYGPVDDEAAVVVMRQLRPFLLGKDGLAGETLWDEMHRLNRHSRAGHFMMAISAVDNALWDLRGRWFKTPVYRLLGGPTRAATEVYGSCLGFSVEPEAAGRKAAELAAQGFRRQKWFTAYGPGDGARGLDLNIALVRSLREAVGDEVDLMFDAFMGWDFNYALGWVKAVERFRPRWIEEPFHVDKLDSFVELSRSTSIPVASGEHFYGRWEVMRFLKAGAISAVQADPEWCGGVSESIKIGALASAFDAHLIPHGHNIHAAQHVVASLSPMTAPLVEFLINKMSSYYFFDKHPPRPTDGVLELSDRPGFGMELDEAKIERRSEPEWV